MKVIIGSDGRIRAIQRISGHPLLVEAATQAINQWVYQPTMSSVENVEVITVIETPFFVFPVNPD